MKPWVVCWAGWVIRDISDVTDPTSIIYRKGCHVKFKVRVLDILTSNTCFGFNFGLLYIYKLLHAYACIQLRYFQILVIIYQIAAVDLKQKIISLIRKTKY